MQNFIAFVFESWKQHLIIGTVFGLILLCELAKLARYVMTGKE